VPELPATLEPLYVTRGNSSPKLHVPFRFEANLDEEYGVNPIYNSMKTEIVLNSSMSKRFLDVYGVNKYNGVTGHKVMVKTEYLEDTLSKERVMLLYSMFRPADDIDYASPPERSTPQIMSPDENMVEMLFRNIDTSPAFISFVPHPDIKPGSIDYTVYFTFHDSVRAYYAGKEYTMSMNSLAINKLMTILDVNEPEDCVGKNVLVYTSFDSKRKKLYICGLTSFDQYVINSPKFEDFKNTR
jgi:hypothetical protein